VTSTTPKIGTPTLSQGTCATIKVGNTNTEKVVSLTVTRFRSPPNGDHGLFLLPGRSGESAVSSGYRDPLCCRARETVSVVEKQGSVRSFECPMFVGGPSLPTFSSAVLEWKLSDKNYSKYNDAVRIRR